MFQEDANADKSQESASNDGRCPHGVPNRSGFLYFIQSGEGGPVKVGWTVDLCDRVDTLQCGNPVVLRPIAWFEVNDARFAEAKVHQDLAAHRIIGEWFARSPAIDAAIEWVRKWAEKNPPVRDIERAHRRARKLSGGRIIGKGRP